MNKSINHKMKIFISSKCGGKYTTIRRTLKKKLEEQNIFTVYCFEEEPASSEKLRDSYIKNLDSSQLMILIIDNKDGISDATFNEYKYARKLGIRIICIFNKGRAKQKTKFEQEIINSGECKFMTVKALSDVPDMALNAVLQDMVFVYGQNRDAKNNRDVLDFDVTKKVNYNRLPDISVIEEQEETVYSLNGGKSPLTQILEHPEYQDKNVYLTGSGGQGKSYTLYEYYQKSNTQQCGKSLYIDLRMVDEKDHDEAIRRYILKTYGCDISDIPLKTIILLDGINELPYGLRKVRENGTSFITTEIKFLLESPFRLVLCSRNEKITVDNNSILAATEELNEYRFIHCKINSLRYEQIAKAIRSSESFPHILKNNLMLSMYMELSSEGIYFDNNSLSGGCLLHRYMEECIWKKARRYLNKCDDIDASKKQIEDADERIKELYMLLTAKAFDSSIPVEAFFEQLDLLDALGVVTRNEDKYIWTDELYQCYFMTCILYLAIKFGGNSYNVCRETEEELHQEEARMLGFMAITIQKYITSFREGLINNNSSYTFQMLYDTIQYTGEILLDNNKEAFETLMRINCNHAEFVIFTSTMYYLIIQNYPNSFKSPKYFCNVIFCGMFAQCETLKSIKIHDSVTQIDEFAFAGCENLKEVVFGENVETISKQAFTQCTSLDSIHIPSNIKVIGEAAFERCSKLSNLHICDGVQTIELCAFYSCQSLKSVFIPRSVATIKGAIFLNCDSLTDVYCEIEEKPLGWDELWLGCEATVHWGVTRQEYNAIAI